MPRFHHSTQKFDALGRKVPKGRGGIQEHKTAYPDCMIFDSKSEYELYMQLLDQEKQGLISNLQYQVKFNLLAGGKWWNNIKEKWEIVRGLDYICDFMFEKEGKIICVDCKGWKQVTDKKTGKQKWSVYYDEIYKIKRKLFLAKYPEYVFQEM